MGAGLIFVLTRADQTDDLNDQPWLPFVLAGFSAALLRAAADAMFRRIEWDDRKVVFRKMFAAPRTAVWSEIASVHDHPLMQMFRVGFAGRTGFGISEMTTGSREFLVHAEREAPGARPGGN